MPRKIYRGFASYLASRGCAVLTYDYRGTGGSRPPAGRGYIQPRSLAGFQATMADWATQGRHRGGGLDARALHTLPLLYVGHSFGGQALGLLPNNTRSRALC